MFAGVPWLWVVPYRRYEMLPEVKLLREAQRRRQDIVERRVKAMQVWSRDFFEAVEEGTTWPAACCGVNENTKSGGGESKRI